MTETTPLAVLTVCTGNICRSPALERLLAQRFGDAVTVSSAGTGAVVGAPIHPPMVALMEAAGVNTAGFAARQINEGIVAGAELIIPLTVEHRSAVLRDSPAALRRCFTILELAAIVTSPDFPALTGETRAERLREAVKLAAAYRALAADAERDVPDPYRRGNESYRHAWDLIVRAVDGLAGVIEPAR
ncbi:MAG: hypothetical protein QM708_03315 [Propioniciclava sp.]|uniref:arsenate reductase/protein-tyrosine-phosphatase family protein n=1 Tax=Propioniciclava sp. TaxID=2038686 RepID=UPI0039E3DE9F